MKWQPYPEYRDSRVDWLEEIPAHWDVKRLRFTCEFNPSKSEIAGLPTDTAVSFLPMEKIGEDGTLVLDEKHLLGDVWQGYTYFRDHDVAIAKITPCFENGKGARLRGLSNGIGFGTTELHVLRPHQDIHPDFMFYLTYSHPFRSLGAASMYGAAGQQRVPENFVKDFATGIPPLSDQRAIAAFLDLETERIDALIAKKERQIELLQEKRAALISHVVTKGLDPNAPMKDSGIEWLGEIPAHWEVKRLKHISPGQSVGVVVTPSLYVDDQGEVPFLYGSDISEGRISVANARRITRESNHILAKSMLRTGDLVTVRVGYPGTTAVVPPELDGCNCASVMIVRNSDSFCSSWLCHAMNSSVGRAHIDIVEYGAAQKQFNISHAVEFVYPVPPIAEQRDIAAHLDCETERIYALIEKIKESIERLQEYRTTLISAAITGKFDVRGQVPVHLTDSRSRMK